MLGDDRLASAPEFIQVNIGQCTFSGERRYAVYFRADMSQYLAWKVAISISLRHDTTEHLQSGLHDHLTYE